MWIFVLQMIHFFHCNYFSPIKHLFILACDFLSLNDSFILIFFNTLTFHSFYKQSIRSHLHVIFFLKTIHLHSHDSYKWFIYFCDQTKIWPFFVCFFFFIYSIKLCTCPYQKKNNEHRLPSSGSTRWLRNGPGRDQHSFWSDLWMVAAAWLLSGATFHWKLC